MRLNRWIVCGNVLVGYIFDSHLPNGTRIMTDAIKTLDISNKEAECLDGKFKLEDPGTYDEHNNNLIGRCK